MKLTIEDRQVIRGLLVDPDEHRREEMACRIERYCEADKMDWLDLEKVTRTFVVAGDQRIQQPAWATHSGRAEWF